MRQHGARTRAPYTEMVVAVETRKAYSMIVASVVEYKFCWDAYRECWCFMVMFFSKSLSLHWYLWKSNCQKCCQLNQRVMALKLLVLGSNKCWQFPTRAENLLHFKDCMYACENTQQINYVKYFANLFSSFKYHNLIKYFMLDGIEFQFNITNNCQSKHCDKWIASSLLLRHGCRYVRLPACLPKIECTAVRNGIINYGFPFISIVHLELKDDRNFIIWQFVNLFPSQLNAIVRLKGFTRELNEWIWWIHKEVLGKVF